MGQLRGPATGTGGAAKRSQLCHGGMKKIEPYRDHSGNPHYRYFPPEIGVVFKFSFTQVPNGLVCLLMAPRRMGSYCRLSPSLSVMWQKSSRWQSTNHLPCPDMFSGLGNVHHKSLVFRAFSWVAGPSCWFCLYIDAWRGSACQRRRPSICTVRVSHGPWCGFRSGEAGPPPLPSSSKHLDPFGDCFKPFKPSGSASLNCAVTMSVESFGSDGAYGESNLFSVPFIDSCSEYHGPCCAGLGCSSAPLLLWISGGRSKRDVEDTYIYIYRIMIYVE